MKKLQRGWGSSSGRSAIGLWYERGGYSCISVKDNVQGTDRPTKANGKTKGPAQIEEMEERA